jgi:hypothetical protein
LIQAAAEPLADNAELQLAARDRIAAELSPRADEQELEVAARRLERSERRGRWRWIWAAVVLVASLPMLSGPGWKLVSAWLDARAVVVPMGTFTAGPQHSFKESLDAGERLLLFGDETAAGSADEWRPLWQSDPGNPMFYIEYAIAYESEHEAVPPDFLATGRRIDPGNGWFALKAAATGVEAVVERDRLSWEDRQAGKEPTWTVKDESAFEKKIDLFKRGALSERIDSYQGKLARKRFEKLPAAGEFTEAIPVTAYVVGTRIDMSEQELADLIVAEARRCRREDDRRAFVELSEALERFFDARLAVARTLLEGLIISAVIETTLPEMRKTAAELEVGEEIWKRRDEALQARRDLLDARRNGEDGDNEMDALIDSHGSMLASLALPMMARQVVESPDLTREDLRPATRADQALLGRVLAGAGWIVIGVFGLASLLVGAMQAGLVRRLSKSLHGLFNQGDACWIGFGGVLAPLLIYLGIRYGTPLSRLDWGPRLTMYAVPVAHFAGLLLMWTVWPTVIAEWRAARAGRVFDWKRPSGWAISAMVAPFAAMLGASFAVPPGAHTQTLLFVASALGGWALIWWLARNWVSTFRNQEGRVRRRVVAHAVRPAWLGAMLAMVGLVFHFHAEERRWFARDEITRIGPEFTAYESRVTEQLKRELREVLE